MPVVGKKNPGGQQEVVLAPLRGDDTGQDRKILIVKLRPRPQQIRGNKEIAVRKRQLSQPRARLGCTQQSRRRARRE